MFFSLILENAAIALFLYFHRAPLLSFGNDMSVRIPLLYNKHPENARDPRISEKRCTSCMQWAAFCSFDMTKLKSQDLTGEAQYSGNAENLYCLNYMQKRSGSQ